MCNMIYKNACMLLIDQRFMTFRHYVAIWPCVFSLGAGVETSQCTRSDVTWLILPSLTEPSAVFSPAEACKEESLNPVWAQPDGSHVGRRAVWKFDECLAGWGGGWEGGASDWCTAWSRQKPKSQTAGWSQVPAQRGRSSCLLEHR